MIVSMLLAILGVSTIIFLIVLIFVVGKLELTPGIIQQQQQSTQHTASDPMSLYAYERLRQQQISAINAQNARNQPKYFKKRYKGSEKIRMPEEEEEEEVVSAAPPTQDCKNPKSDAEYLTCKYNLIKDCGDFINPYTFETEADDWLEWEATCSQNALNKTYQNVKHPYQLLACNYHKRFNTLETVSPEIAAQQKDLKERVMEKMVLHEPTQQEKDLFNLCNSDKCYTSNRTNCVGPDGWNVYNQCFPLLDTGRYGKFFDSPKVAQYEAVFNNLDCDAYFKGDSTVEVE